MQIILASAKIMNDRSATKGDACQSKKVKSSPDISLSLPRFQNEADCFARDMAQYSAETIADMLGCSLQIAAQNRMRFFEDAPKLPAILGRHVVVQGFQLGQSQFFHGMFDNTYQLITPIIFRLGEFVHVCHSS